MASGGLQSTLKTQQALKAALKASNHKILELSPGQKIKFQGATFEILAIRNPELIANAVNNQSAVWRVDVNNDGDYADPGESFEFYRLLGDANGDALVDALDSSTVDQYFVESNLYAFSSPL